MRSKSFARRAGFTILEVPVVTTIIASQANNYGNVKKLAYQKSCENNLRQLYMGLQMYDMANGELPAAAFYPKNPKKGGNSIVKLMDSAYEEMFVCPVFPSAIKDKGLTYIYNDTLGGQSLDSISDPGETWLLMEMNAVSSEIRMPHPGGFHILYADGKVKAVKEIPKVFAEIQERAKETEGKKKGS